MGKGRQNLIRQLFGKVRLRCLIYNKHWFKCKLHVSIKTSQLFYKSKELKLYAGQIFSQQ